MTGNRDAPDREAPDRKASAHGGYGRTAPQRDTWGPGASCAASAAPDRAYFGRAGPPRLLITRPAEDAETMADAIRDHGFEPVLAPLLDLHWRTGPPPSLSGVQGLLFTSANGVRAFVHACAGTASGAGTGTGAGTETGAGLPLSLPAYAVGAATARAARAAGFRNILSADGDVTALAALVGAHCRPEDGPLLHCAGSVTAGDLAGSLARLGLAVERAVLYEARPAPHLPQAAASALASGALAGVLLFSPRTATQFVDLCARAGLIACCAPLIAGCLSAAVAERAGHTADGQPLPWRELLVAERPTQEALLAALERRLGPGS